MQSLNDLMWDDMFEDSEQDVLDRINPVLTGVISITCTSISSSCSSGCTCTTGKTGCH